MVAPWIDVGGSLKEFDIYLIEDRSKSIYLPIVEDTYRQKGLRAHLIRDLRDKGISNEAVLEAMGNVPRHQFLDAAFADWAYKDKPFSIGWDQTISQPYTVAIQTILLDVQKGDKILEIGTGSGYQASILAELGAEVYTIERMQGLYEKTAALLQEMGRDSIHLFYGDGNQGLEEHAPFDKILITAGAEELPKALLQQLKIGGYLVAPVGGSSGQTMFRFYKKAENHFQKDSFGKFSFVPMLKGINDAS